MDKVQNIFKNILQFLSFILLITLYVLHKGYLAIRSKILKRDVNQTSRVTGLYQAFIKNLDKGRQDSIKRINLIEISLKNMSAKKTRTWITMGGMAIGISFIVFLVSIGYGLERLIINRVAQLNELRQTDVVPGLSDELVLNDATVASFRQIQGVAEAIPLISAVGKVNLNNSVTNMAVYGVTTNYLEHSAIQTTTGKLFENNDLAVQEGKEGKEVKGVSAKKEISDDTKLIVDSRVLGENDEALPIVDIPSLSGEEKSDNTIILNVGGTDVKELVINQAALQVLGLNEKDAIDKTIKLTFYIVDANGNVEDSKVQSVETQYTIVGVLPDESTPVVYVPFVDLKSLGVVNYSQIKVIAQNPESLGNVRTAIESSGYGTISVADTVSQIDRLFSTARLFLAILGVVALSVASLGMVNTLTVSLLERTHEVGLMKAIGMKSEEVKELFMTESMIMGFFGGVLGLLLGIGVGWLTNLIVSIFSIAQGVGFVQISYVPFSFGLAILILSLLVGVGTGYVPAKRATMISALDALRYE